MAYTVSSGTLNSTMRYHTIFGSEPDLSVTSFHFIQTFWPELFLLAEHRHVQALVPSASRHFRCSYLRANKVTKSERTSKVEQAHHFLKVCWCCFARNYQN